MASLVNLDALIPREDFQVKSEGIDAPRKQTIPINELEKDAFFYLALRKPDFQRETAEWGPERVVGLIRTFIEGDLIPGVILWKNRDLLFVIDGSHRLSALIAWVQNDYGDGARSHEFFNHDIPDEQLKIAQRTRRLVEKAFGSYQDHKDAISNHEKYGPDIVARARRFGSLALELQWVTGDFVKAENSFIRINQQAAIIRPQDLKLIKSRKKPNAIAARAIIRRGTGHKYWAFDDKRKAEIEATATDLHRLLFDPQLRYPIKSLDLPAGGSVSAAPALPMVYDFINLCLGTPSPDDDVDGQRTIDYLNRCRHVMRLVLSNHPSSLGLHPAVYFYSWTGKQQPILFLVVTQLLIDYERRNKLPDFIRIRGALEAFLMSNRPLINQLVRKFGTKSSGETNLMGFYTDVIRLIGEGVSPDAIAPRLKQLQNETYAYLQPDEVPQDGGLPASFSTQVKSGIVLRELLQTAPRCGICQGLVPAQALSVDHVERRQDGGLAIVSNAQLTHPYCNTGFKESEHARQRRAGRGAGMTALQ